MKIRMRSLRFFILLFAASSLLFHPPSDFEAFAEHTDGSFVEKIQEINYTTLLADTGFELGDTDSFGISVANIGDLDGDGVNDLAVGALYDDTGGTNRGAVHIMFMDIDGSVKSTKTISNATNGPNLANKAYFGISVANISDLDGDGVNDLVVGAHGDSAIHIMFMNIDGTVKSIAKNTASGATASGGNEYGFSVANIGDLDGDGVNDIAVGEHLANKIHILLMNTDGTVKSTTEINSSTTDGPTLAANDRFGVSVANIGDLDGDGVNDLAVGAHRDNGAGGDLTKSGAVHIIFMKTGGDLVKSTEEINDSTTSLELAANDMFGISVANIGDLDGDGVNDLAVGASYDSTNNSGAVHIIFMNIDGTVKSTEEINSSTTCTSSPCLELAANDQFGSSIANIGDLDGNGVIDLAVGAWFDDAGGSNRGAVHIFFLHETTKPTVTITSTSGDSGDTVSSTTLSYTATFSESVTGFVVGDITVTGTANSGSPAASNFAGSGTTYTFDVVRGSSDGTVLVSVAAGVATDAAGNENTASNTYTLTIHFPSSSGTCTRHVILGNCGTIAINNDEYRIINTWTNVPTTEVLVGEPVTVTLSTPNNPTHTKIHFASVHTEVFSIPLDYQQSAHIDYSIMNNQVTYVSQSQLFQVAGATHRIVQDPDVKNLKMFEVVFTMVFAKPMETSHVVVETKNRYGIPETLYLLDALKVIERPIELLTMEEKSKFEIISEPGLKASLRPDMDIEPNMLSIDPEPVVSKVTCGNGTMLKDNLCVANEMSFYFFVNQFMRFFG